MRSVLLVEDHAESRRSLAYLLSQRGYEVLEAANGRAAVGIARREKLHALILDLKLPDMDGLAVLDAVMECHPALPAIVVTAYGTIDGAVEAMKRGASEFLTKPISVDALIAALARGIERAGALGAVPTPSSEAVAEMERLGIIGQSEGMRSLFDRIKHIAPHQSTVLVVGESGTGKELVARALHALGPSSAGPFVAINCATLSEHILASELFGHEKGAFTGADRAHAGVMEMANGGTLFLDEVGSMGLDCQAKLLRALERREFRRVGGTRKVKVDLAVIAACNTPLDERVSAGQFRADLYYRLAVVTVAVPPLRERKEAIPILARRFLAEVAQRTGIPPRELTHEAMQHLERYAWPGNVRELRNAMESLTLTTTRAIIDVPDLPPVIRGAAPAEVSFGPGVRLDEVEREIIRLNLAAYPTLKDAARALGVPLRTFHDKVRKHGLRRRP